MLSPEQLERLRQQLLDERIQLQQDIDGLNTDELSTDADVGVGNHMANDATEVFNQEAQISLRRNQQHALNEVNRAIQRMDNGTYGVCERCGRAIDFARLKAAPAALYDLDCQRLVEAQV